MTKRNLEHAVCLESLAGFSAPSRRGLVGHIVLKNIRDVGFGSDTWMINPKSDGIAGRRCCTISGSYQVLRTLPSSRHLLAPVPESSLILVLVTG